MKRLLTLIAFIFSLPFVVQANGVEEKEDSLAAAIFNSTDPSEKIHLMSELSDLYERSQPEKVLEIARQAEEVAESDEDIAYSWNFVGRGFLVLGELDSALHYFQQTYELTQQTQDSVNMSKAINNIGIVQLSSGNIDQGMDAMQESAKIDLMLKEYDGAMISLLNLGAIYVQLNEYDKAKENSLKALDLSLQIGDKYYRADIYGNLGAAEFKMGNIDGGKDWFFKAIELHESMNDLEGVQRQYENLAYAFRTEGKYKIAEVYYLKSLEYAEALNSAEAYREIYNGLALNNEAMGKEGRALDYYKLFMAWKDTVIKRQNNAALIEMQEKFNTEQTAKENEILQQENHIKKLENRESKAKLNQSRIVVFSVTIGLLLLMGLAIVLFNRNRIKQKANSELQMANDIIREKNEDITASIEYASKIQEALLPTKENLKLFKDSFFILMPKDIVSGDFLWYSEVGDKVVFTVADCTGHGVPGAFMSMIGNTYLQQIVNERKVLTPSLILDELRENVIGALSQQDGEDARKDGMDMALCVLDRKTMTLEFAGANNPLYVVRNGEMQEIKGDKQPVGYMPERNGKFTNHTVDLSEGDAIYIFSDGYADQFGGPKGKKFKYKQMRELLHLNFSKSMAEQKQIMSQAFHQWKGDLEQIDDVCLIGVRV